MLQLITTDDEKRGLYLYDASAKAPDNAIMRMAKLQLGKQQVAEIELFPGRLTCELDKNRFFSN